MCIRDRTNAVKDRGSPFRIPVFICGDQYDFDGRIVVLRKADETNNFVQYHSDIRSDKIAKLKANKNAALLFYDKEEKIQVRLKVECTVNHDNEITKESWLKTQHISRKCYLVDEGPGTESEIPTSGLKPELDNFDYTKEQYQSQIIFSFLIEQSSLSCPNGYHPFLELLHSSHQ